MALLQERLNFSVYISGTVQEFIPWMFTNQMHMVPPFSAYLISLPFKKNFKTYEKVHSQMTLNQIGPNLVDTIYEGRQTKGPSDFMIDNSVLM